MLKAQVLQLPVEAVAVMGVFWELTHNEPVSNSEISLLH